MKVEGFTRKGYRYKGTRIELKNHNIELVEEEGIKKPHYMIQFASMYEMLKCVDHNSQEHGNKSWTNKGINFRYGNTAYDQWVYGNDYDSYRMTKEYLYRGAVLPKTLDQYSKLREQFETEYPELFDLLNLAMKMRKRRKFAEDGHELDIDRYMSGDPEHWEIRHLIKDKKTIKICYNVALSFENNPEMFIKNTILCSIFIDIVETLGLNCEFWLCSCIFEVTSRTKVNYIMMPIKEANEAIDIQKILAIGIPGMFRYYIFRLLANLIPGVVDDGLGSPLIGIRKWFLKMYEFDVAVNAGADPETNVNAIIDKVKFLIEQ